MKFIAPFDLKISFKQLYDLFCRKEIGFVGINIKKATIWLPIKYDDRNPQISLMPSNPQTLHSFIPAMIMWQNQDMDMISEVVSYIRNKNGDYDNLKKFNSQICKKCKGNCCKSEGCLYSPSNFKEIAFDSLKEFICRGYSTIILVREFYTGLEDSFVLKARRVGEPVVKTKIIKHTPCILLTDKGCMLSEDDRPKGGKELIPSETGGCIPAYTYRKAVEEWMPYQKILEDLARFFINKNIPFNGV